MTQASVALLRHLGGLSNANPRMLAKAAFVLIVADPAVPSKDVLPARDMVMALRSGGLPVTCIAEMLKVERKTVYAWLDGSDPREANVSRIESLFKLLVSTRVDLRSLHRVWNRRLEHGHCIRELLAADPISEPAVKDALRMLAPSMERHSLRDRGRQSPEGGWDIPLLDEMPTAGSR